MHEMSLVNGILRILEEQAVSHGFSRITTVWLEVGQLSHAEPEALAFAFQATSPGTIAEGARLEFIRTPGAAWCMTCSQTVPVAQRGDSCPHCGGYQLQVTAGEELRVRELEVD